MDRNTLVAMLHDMLLARVFEERAAQEYTKGNIAGFLHLYPGEEAVAVSAIHSAEPSDYIISTYPSMFTRWCAAFPLMPS